MMAFLMTAAAAAAGDSREDVQRKLEAKVSIQLRQVRLADALDVFRNATGLNFVAAEGGELAVSLTVHDVSAKSALRLLLAPADLSAAFENGAVVIRSRKSLAGAATLKVYDVRATLVKVQDFPAPRMGLLGPVVGVVFG